MTTTHPMQRTFDELRRARATDPQTSKAAAAQSHGLAAAHSEAILRALACPGLNDLGRSLSCLTAHEIASRSGLQPVQVSRRIAQLRDDGLIVAADETRVTPSGRAAQCWRLA
jgi:hypothetical protein